MALEDLRDEILRYSTEAGCPADSIEQLVCDCGGEDFTLFSDGAQGGALAVCFACEMNHSIYDSADFIEDVGQNVCACDAEVLKLMIGMAHREGGPDVRWIYVGAKCAACGLTGVFVDWEEP